MAITIFSLLVLLFSTMIHEIAHGSVAYYLGDGTAKREGRLTLNPLKHLDPIGSVLVPLSLFIFTGGQGPIFGWAKPVPVNPYNLRDQKWGSVKVSLAGAATNIIIGIVFGLLCRFFILPTAVFRLFSIIIIYNFAWAIFNLLPIPPLDGHWILFALLPARWQGLMEFLKRYGHFILIIFIFSGIHWIYQAAELLYRLICG
ncbi:MAG: site-2 protease family protein [bacterium]